MALGVELLREMEPEKAQDFKDVQDVVNTHLLGEKNDEREQSEADNEENPSVDPEEPVDPGAQASRDHGRVWTCNPSASLA